MLLPSSTVPVCNSRCNPGRLGAAGRRPRSADRGALPGHLVPARVPRPTIKPTP